MKKKIEGYVYPPSLQKYRNGTHEGLYVWSKPKVRWGITGLHVTLSPACPERSRRVQSQEPDYKAMWEEAIDMLTYVYHTPTKKIDWTLVEKLFAKHTPQGDQTEVKKGET